MKKRVIFRSAVVALLVLPLPCPMHAQELAVTARASGAIPSGPAGPEGEKLYATGFGASIGVEMRLRSVQFLAFHASIDSSVAPTTGGTSLYLVAPGIGVSLVGSPGEKWDTMLTVSGGYALGIYEGNAGSSGYIDGGLSLDYHLSPAFSVGLGGGYRHVFGLHQSAYGGLRLRVRPSAIAKRAKMEIAETTVNDHRQRRWLYGPGLWKRPNCCSSSSSSRSCSSWYLT